VEFAVNSSLKDFIVSFPTTICSPPSIPKVIMDLTKYGDGKKLANGLPCQFPD